MAKTPSNHYVSNVEFFEAVVQYKKECAEADESGSARPPIPEYIGECILKIAQRVSTKPNFANYTYRDEMVSDGVETSLLYFHNFDPAKSSNPFAYFTQVIWYAFLRRIQKEKKQTHIKNKMIMMLPVDAFELAKHDDGSGAVNSYIEYMKNNLTEDKLAKPKKTTPKSKVTKLPTIESILDE